MFNEKLFYSLCEKHGVELSSNYDKPMIQVDNEIRALTADDIKNIIPSFQHYIFYDSSNITSSQKTAQAYCPNELITAC